jgi:SAM-dependent methyltransferase
MDNFDLSVQRFNEFAHEYAERFRIIDAYIPSVESFCSRINAKNPAILELACGPGNFTRYLKQHFPESDILAIDLAPGMIDIAQSQVKGVDFRVMDVRDILKINKDFDAIMCSFCLPFLSAKDTNRLIADCSIRLLVGGVIYISTMEGDESMAGFETTSFSGKAEIYFNYHRQKDIEAALAENGFTIDEFKQQDYREPDGNILTDMIFIASLQK